MSTSGDCFPKSEAKSSGSPPGWPAALKVINPVYPQNFTFTKYCSITLGRCSYRILYLLNGLLAKEVGPTSVSPLTSAPLPGSGRFSWSSNILCWAVLSALLHKTLPPAGTEPRAVCVCQITDRAAAASSLLLLVFFYFCSSWSACAATSSILCLIALNPSSTIPSPLPLLLPLIHLFPPDTSCCSPPPPPPAAPHHFSYCTWLAALNT